MTKRLFLLLQLFALLFVSVMTVSCKKDEPEEVVVKTGCETITARGATFNMIFVQGGTFTMGATSEQGTEDPGSNEYPTHKVTLSDYYIGETEVTQDLWISVMGGNDPAVHQSLPNPVENVSWNDCQEFIARLNQITGKHFRLPTEAEWEYAARGGAYQSDYKYSGSNNYADVAWYCENSNYTTHPVKQKQPNKLGIYDMSGNVHEWCYDVYGLYTAEAQTNPQGSNSSSDHVIRGGAWLNTSNYCRVSYRYCYCVSQKNQYLGLRLAMSE